MQSSLLLCITHSLLVSSAALPQNSANVLTTGPNNAETNYLNPHAISLPPPPNLPSTPTAPEPAAASSANPAIPSIAPSDAAFPPSNSTADSPPDIPGLNITDLSNPGRTLTDASADLGYNAYCWSPRQVHAIAEPSDCDLALKLLFAEGKALTMVTWTAPRSWTVHSCAVLLTPQRPAIRAEDSFTRLDIVYAVSHIQRACVNGMHGFRGGHMGIGPQDMFYVSVEALG